MSEMIERVARRLFGELGWEGVGAHPAFEHDQDLWLKAASAAIEAMREPTEAMHDAGDNTFDWTSSDLNGSFHPQRAEATECWRAMIDAALAK